MNLGSERSVKTGGRTDWTKFCQKIDNIDGSDFIVLATGAIIMAVLDPLLRPLIRTGHLTVIDWRGRASHYGDQTGKQVTIRIQNRATALRILFDPQLAVGEVYVDGLLTLESGSIYDLLDLAMRNMGLGTLAYPFAPVMDRIRTWLRTLHQNNHSSRARRNVAHHYDLSSQLYELFLDADQQYSCAYFLKPDDSLERAQAQKKRHIAAKLLLEPGHRVLDIGSGWGGLGLYLADIGGTDVTGVTLSTEQFQISNARSKEAGRADRVRFIMRDYRSEIGTYDRIVSVGMFEHVGIGHYDEYFKTIARCLNDDGVALVHAIGRADGPGHTNPWISKYIFPGGYCPALSEVLPAIERAGLLVTDIEILRLHYADTLRLWRERFEANRAAIRSLYDERFCRMWEFYLICSELAFRYQGQMVFQIQVAKRSDAVPITRDYIAQFEAKHPIETEFASSKAGLRVA